MGRTLLPIGLGQAVAPLRVASSGQTVTLTKEEAELVIRTVEDVIAFANDNPIEFHAYCPPDDWKATLERVGQMTAELERHRGGGSVNVPRDGMLALFDLQECLIGARDEKLSSVKTTLVVSAGAAVAGTLLAIPWLSIPAYVVSLGIIFGKPLLMYLRGDRPEPFKIGCTGSPALGHHTAKGTILERAVVSSDGARYWWGVARRAGVGGPESVCLGKGDFRVRAEGRTGLSIEPASGWEVLPPAACALHERELVIWEPCGTKPRGGAPPGSGFAESFWVDYWGPATNGVCRTAGPFG
jgi:hypothetical protein